MNNLVINRLDQIRKILIEAHRGGKGMAASSVGAERESFVSLVLSNVISPPFRIGTSEITNPEGITSGQVDLVIEYSSSLSFPLLRGDSSRLYLAEGIAAVIEVKSDIRKHWNDVIKKAAAVHRVKRDLGVLSAMSYMPENHIPFFAVGFTGWSNSERVAEKVKAQVSSDAPVDGVLVIDKGIYAGREGGMWDDDLGYSAYSKTGPAALYGFLLSIEQLTSGMIWSKPAYKSYIEGNDSGT